MKKIVFIALTFFLITGIFTYVSIQYNKENASNYIPPSSDPAVIELYTTNTTEVSYAFDLDYASIYESVTNVSIVKIESINDSFYETESGTIYTNYTISNKQNIKGSAPEIFDVNIQGGFITMQEYVNSLKPEQVIKMGLDDLTSKELNQYIMEVGEAAVDDITVGNQMLILYNKNDDSNYIVVAGGYGIYDLENYQYINKFTKEVANL